MSLKAKSLTHRQRSFIFGALLAVGTLLLYAQTGSYEFVNYDDPSYVAKNTVVQQGISAEGFDYAFKETGMSDWYPVLYLSYMTDVSLFGADNPAAHHKVNAALHIINVLLLFALLTQCTSAPGRCALLAALFAIHPLHVESIAWISARKDVLSTLFWLLACYAYWKYAKRRDQKHRCWPWYAGVTLFFLAGCLTKAMLVTLPVAFLLIDYWPLKRLIKTSDGSYHFPLSLKKLGVEKLPWIAISLAIGITHLIITHKSVDDLEELSLVEHTAVAIVSYAGYLYKILWPVDLAVYYPHPAEIDTEFLSHPAFIGRLIISAIVLAAITAISWTQRQKRPYLLVGWIWYLLVLAPVSGLVSFASFYLSDRYAYVPIWGIYLMLVWGGWDLIRGKVWAMTTARVIVPVALAALFFMSHRQIQVWKNSKTLLTHCLAKTDHNHFAHNSLGKELLLEGQTEEAVAHFKSSLQIKDDYTNARNNLATGLLTLGRVNEAEAELRLALKQDPEESLTLYNLGNMMLAKQRFAEAIDFYREAVRIDPKQADAHHNWGIALHQLGEIEKALAQYDLALNIDPQHPDAQYNMANAYIALRRYDDAIKHLQDLLANHPNHANGHNNLGQLYQIQGQYPQALHHYEKALSIVPQHPQAKTNRNKLMQYLNR